jgi:hypothetical protein
MFRTLNPKLALTAILALVIAGLAITAAPAANTVEINSRIVMRQSFPAFHGKVKSSNEACVQNRVVKLFKKRRNGGRRLLGRTHTNGAGKWKVIVDPLSSGVYRSVVKRREEGAAGTIFVCRRDSSRPAVVD